MDMHLRKLTLVLSVLLLQLTLSHVAHAACSAAPVGTAADPVLQTRLNGDSKAGLGAANSLTSTEEGAIVWDDTNNTLVACDGTNWIQLGDSHLPTGCSSGETVEWDGSDWVCASNSAAAAEFYSTAAGSGYSCGLKPAGTVWCWGSDGSGKLGNGAGGSTVSPEQIAEAGPWVHVDIGVSGSTTCAVKSDLTAWCWGQNTYGQVGDGTTIQKESPTQVSGGGTWKSLSAGTYHTCGVKTDNTAWCWGENNVGQLGIGSTSNKSIPTQIPGDPDWQSISAGYDYTCGIKIDDTAWCWGEGGSQRLGNGSTTDRTSPRAVSGGLSFSKIDAGHTATLALDTTNHLYGWGGNGNGTGSSQSTPAAVSATETWLDMSSGDQQSCAVKSDGTAWCWGINNYGELGFGTLDDPLTPTAVISSDGWKTISTGSSHTCGTRSHGNALCWGRNSSEQLGFESEAAYNIYMPVKMPN